MGSVADCICWNTCRSQQLLLQTGVCGNNSNFPTSKTFLALTLFRSKFGESLELPQANSKNQGMKNSYETQLQIGSYSNTDVSDSRRESKPSKTTESFHSLHNSWFCFFFLFKSLMGLKEEKFKIRSKLWTAIRGTEVAVVVTRIKSWAAIIAYSEQSWAPVLQQGFSAPGWPWYKV